MTLWTILRECPEEMKDTPLEQGVPWAAEQIQIPGAEPFRKAAVENVLRILRNKRRRNRVAKRDAALREFVISI